MFIRGRHDLGRLAAEDGPEEPGDGDDAGDLPQPLEHDEAGLALGGRLRLGRGSGARPILLSLSGSP